MYSLVPLETMQIVIDDYFQPTTYLNRQVLVFENVFPYTKSLVVDKLYVLREPGNLLVNAHVYIVHEDSSNR